MGSTVVQEELGKKEDNAEQIARRVLEDSSLVSYILGGLSSPKPGIRFKCAKILRIVSEKDPEELYHYFDSFRELINSKNSIIKWNAMDIVANLATVDSRNRFDAIFEDFYSFLSEGSLVTSAHVVDNSGKIARAKPNLRDRITEELLQVERIPLPTEECRNILKGKLIAAFCQYFDGAKNKDMIASFVRSQLNNTRKSTKKRAEQFLRQFAVD